MSNYYFFDASDQLRWQVWLKGRVDPRYDPNMIRRDRYGAWMQWDQHGNRQHDFGWEIDHITPVSRGGGNELSNLQPLWWKNNVAKANT